MKYYVTIEEKTLEIDITDAVATIDGKQLPIDLRPISADTLFSLIVGSSSHEVLVEGPANALEVTVGGELFHIVVQDEWEYRLANIQRKDKTETGETTVRAPMPGQVLRVEVEEGAIVKRGQGLVILSAMKMENEIRSPRDGRVVKVHVVEADKVEQNAELVTIGPADAA